MSDIFTAAGTKKGKERDTYFSKKITFLNVLLTFTIVLLHAKTPERWGLPLDMAHPFIYWMTALTQVGVPTFFFISGLLFYRQCRFADIERKLLSRGRSLVAPYLVWNVFFVGIFFVMLRMPVIHEKMRMGEALLSFDEVLYAILNARYTVLWFVKDLIIFCTLSALVFLLLKNKKIAFATLAFSTVMVITGDYGYEHPFTWFPVYFMGCIKGRFYTFTTDGTYCSITVFLKDKAKRYCFVVVVVAVFSVLYLSSVYNERVLFLFRLCSPIILWWLTDLLLNDFISRRFKVRRWMNYMFFIFCTHQFILNVLQKFVVLIFPPTDTVLNVTYLITPVLTVLIAIESARFFSRYKFYALLSGGR